MTIDKVNPSTLLSITSKLQCPCFCSQPCSEEEESERLLSVLHFSVNLKLTINLQQGKIHSSARVLSYHQRLSTCLIRVSNKVRILYKYLHILMENSPATSQIFYPLLNINIHNQFSFHWKVKYYKILSWCVFMWFLEASSWSRELIKTQNALNIWENPMLKGWGGRKNAYRFFDILQELAESWCHLLYSDWQIVQDVLRYPSIPPEIYLHEF